MWECSSKLNLWVCPLVLKVGTSSKFSSPFTWELPECCSCTQMILGSAVQCILCNPSWLRTCADTWLSSTKIKEYFREMMIWPQNSYRLSVKYIFSTDFLHNVFLLKCSSVVPFLRGWTPRAFCRANTSHVFFLWDYIYILWRLYSVQTKVLGVVFTPAPQLCTHELNSKLLTATSKVWGLAGKNYCCWLSYSPS